MNLTEVAIFRAGTISAHVEKVATDAIQPPNAELRQGDPECRKLITMLDRAERTQSLLSLTLRLHATRLVVYGVAIAERRTGEKRRILEYVFSPLIEVANDRLRESEFSS